MHLHLFVNQSNVSDAGTTTVNTLSLDSNLDPRMFFKSSNVYYNLFIAF